MGYCEVEGKLGNQHDHVMCMAKFLPSPHILVNKMYTY